MNSLYVPQRAGTGRLDRSESALPEAHVKFIQLLMRPVIQCSILTPDFLHRQSEYESSTHAEKAKSGINKNEVAFIESTIIQSYRFINYLKREGQLTVCKHKTISVLRTRLLAVSGGLFTVFPAI
jgi:hypothetical protein